MHINLLVPHTPRDPGLYAGDWMAQGYMRCKQFDFQNFVGINYYLFISMTVSANGNDSCKLIAVATNYLSAYSSRKAKPETLCNKAGACGAH